MTAAAEWTKLWTVRATWWCLASAVVLMGCTAFLLGNDFAYDLEHPDEQAVRDTAATTSRSWTRRRRRSRWPSSR